MVSFHSVLLAVSFFLFAVYGCSTLYICVVLFHLFLFSFVGFAVLFFFFFFFGGGGGGGLAHAYQYHMNYLINMLILFCSFQLLLWLSLI